MPVVSFQRLKSSQGLLFSAGALGICLKNKRILLSHKEAQARERPGEKAWIPAQAASPLSLLKKAALHFAAIFTVS